MEEYEKICEISSILLTVLTYNVIIQIAFKKVEC